MPYGTPAVDQMVLNYNASYKVNTRNCNLHIAAMYFKSLDLIILQTLREKFIINFHEPSTVIKQPVFSNNLIKNLTSILFKLSPCFPSPLNH